jgi:phytoene synthase
LYVLPDAVTHVAYEMCERNSVSRTLLAEQVRAAARFAGPIRFDTYSALQDFILQWAGSHAQALAGLAGYKHSWQLRHIDELATAFFLVGRLTRIPRDLVRDHLFIPLDELADTGVTLDQLREGTMNEAMRRLLWKQAVRIRDAFAQGQALVNDLEGREARQFKRWWLGGLEVINEIERRKYDLWKRPITLSSIQRFRVSLQALMGRTTFR